MSTKNLEYLFPFLEIVIWLISHHLNIILKICFGDMFFDWHYVHDVFVFEYTYKLNNMTIPLGMSKNVGVVINGMGDP